MSNILIYVEDSFMISTIWLLFTWAGFKLNDESGGATRDSG